MRSPTRRVSRCARGQHTRSVLAELGYSELQIDALVDTGVVSAGDS